MSATKKETIDNFYGEHYWLSNFYLIPVALDGKVWPSTEHYYQAMKSESQEDRELIRKLRSPGQSRKAGRKLELRPDWKTAKDQVMWDALCAKFGQHLDLKEKLLATGDATLIEGNTWNDTYWGVCEGVGANKLGQLLMQLREEFRAE